MSPDGITPGAFPSSRGMKWLPSPPRRPAASSPPPALLYITLVSFLDYPHLYLRHSRCSVICRRSKRLSVSGSFVRRSHPYGRSRIDRCFLFYATCCLVLTAIWESLLVRESRSPRAGPSPYCTSWSLAAHCTRRPPASTIPTLPYGPNNCMRSLSHGLFGH